MSGLVLPGVPFLISLLLVLAAGQPVIAYLRSQKKVQPISEDAPEKHRLKHGTPTMGGVLILGAVALTLIGWLIWERFKGNSSGSGLLTGTQRGHLLSTLAIFLGGGLIGVLDDVGKARKKQNKAGLSEKAKLGLQGILALAFVVYLYLDKQDTTILGLNLGVFYFGLALLYLVGFSNAVNLTDGLDGLSSGVTLIVAATLSVATLVGTPELAVFYGALAGACAGFLWFNAYPARVFMGDTGSLAIGMGLAAAAISAQQEILLFIVGAVYVVEIASMMIQRYVFKYRRIKHGLEYAQSHRVFRRAPLHHHFEELEWHEVQVVTRFWMATLLIAISALLLRLMGVFA